jgi:dTDP-4-amino-4,6-dideoxygalactose transaminase
MDPVALEKAFELYPDVKLVISAELYGFPGRMDEIKRICEKHGALLIEDAAEAMGASIRSGSTYHGDKCGRDEEEQGEQCCSERSEGRQCGSFGDYAAVSYNGNKIITGSAGGCLLTNSETDANKARKWSTQSRENAPWYQHEEVGYNYRMSNVIAGVVRGQYGHLEEHIRDKKRIYERYRDGFKGLPVKMNPITPNTEPNYWLSCLLINREAMCKQVRGGNEALYVAESGKSCPTEILEALSGINAEGRSIWKPMHMQPMYRMHEVIGRDGSLRCRTNAYIEGSVEDVGADIFNRGVCLPSDNKMTAEEQDRVIEVIRGCFG